MECKHERCNFDGKTLECAICRATWPASQYAAHTSMQNISINDLEALQKLQQTLGDPRKRVTVPMEPYAPPQPTFQTPVTLYMIGDTLYAEGPEKRLVIQAFWDQGWRREEAPAPETPASEALPFSEAAQAEWPVFTAEWLGQEWVKQATLNYGGAWHGMANAINARLAAEGFTLGIPPATERAALEWLTAIVHEVRDTHGTFSGAQLLDLVAVDTLLHRLGMKRDGWEVVPK